MSRMEIEAKLQEIENKEAFIAALGKAASSEETVAVLKEYGIETSVEELEKELAQEECGKELEEEELESVAGGCICGGKLQHWLYNLACRLVGIKGCKG